MKNNKSVVLGGLLLTIQNIPAQSFRNTFKFIACCHEDFLQTRMEEGCWRMEVHIGHKPDFKP